MSSKGWGFADFCVFGDGDESGMVDETGVFVLLIVVITRVGVVFVFMAFGGGFLGIVFEFIRGQACQPFRNSPLLRQVMT